jgi:hypothetical protein
MVSQKLGGTPCWLVLCLLAAAAAAPLATAARINAVSQTNPYYMRPQCTCLSGSFKPLAANAPCCALGLEWASTTCQLLHVCRIPVVSALQAANGTVMTA